MENNYTALHLHSDYSLLDSATKYESYIDRAKELGQTAICFTEHGKTPGWFNKMQYCKAKGLKYIHGVEIYLTESLNEKVRDNYHTILIAKNASGFKELNSLVSRAFDKEHFYYTGRLTFDEFLNISDDVIRMSACLASPLNKLPVTHKRYKQLLTKYNYLEIQPHLCEEQIAYNRHLAEMSQKFNIPLVATTDAHSLNKYYEGCREVLMVTKGQVYDGGGFDLTYKSYDEMLNAFRKQAAIPEYMFVEALENTNVIRDSVEDYHIDTSIRYPKLYGSKEKDHEKLLEFIDKKYNEKVTKGIIPVSQQAAFKDAIKEEIRVFTKVGMDGFMLAMGEIIEWCRNHDIIIGPGRGSVTGSRVAYVTDVTDVNPEKWDTIFSRFCNESRVEVGDIDIDVTAEDRPKIFEYIIDRFGADKTARIPTYGTLQDKAAIKLIVNYYKKQWEKEHGSAGKGQCPFTISYAEEIINIYKENADEAREKYPDIFKYFDGLNGIKQSQSIHPAGIVISPITLEDNVGVFNKDGERCLLIDMDEVHDIGLVKFDFLVLETLDMLSDCYKYIGIPYPRAHEIDWEDKAVWEDMITSSVGIFQFEGEYAMSLLRRFKPQNIFDMCLIAAALRPSGASYRDDLIERKPHKNPSPMIDELLANNNGYLVYQEDVIAFLQKICGLSGGEADNVRRAIGRKDVDRLNKALPQILDGYCKKSDKPREIAEQEANEFIQILKDSSEYMFGKNHSISYCLFGYMSAYLRYYYPLEFITSYLNHESKDENITKAVEFAKLKGIKISNPVFGISTGTYFFDKETNTIAKGVGSIKGVSAALGDELYEFSKRIHTDSFSELLMEMYAQCKGINRAKITTLIRLDYFRNYGNAPTLEKIYSTMDEIGVLKERKSLPATLTANAEFMKIAEPYVDRYTKTGKLAKNAAIKDRAGLIRAVEKHIRSLNIQDYDTRIKLKMQMEYIGYILPTNEASDRKKLYVEKVQRLKSKSTGKVWAYVLNTISIGTGKAGRLTLRKWRYDTSPVKEKDVIYVNQIIKDKKGYWNLMEYVHI